MSSTFDADPLDRSALCAAFRRAEIRKIVAGHRAHFTTGSAEGHDTGISPLAHRAGTAEIPVIGGQFLTAVRTSDAGAAAVRIVGAGGLEEVRVGGVDLGGWHRAVGAGSDWGAGSAKAGVFPAGCYPVELVEVGLGEAADFIHFEDGVATGGRVDLAAVQSDVTVGVFLMAIMGLADIEVDGGGIALGRIGEGLQ